MNRQNNDAERIARLARETQRKFGEYADDYAASRAEAANQMGAEARSEIWEEVEEYIEREADGDSDEAPGAKGRSSH